MKKWIILALVAVSGCGSNSTTTIHFHVSSALAALESDYQAGSPRLYLCQDSPTEVGDQKTCQTDLVKDDITVTGFQDVVIDGLSAGLYYFQVTYGPKDTDCQKDLLGASGTFEVDSQGRGAVTLTILDVGPSCSS
jgi:hypothetical protein